MIPGWMDPFSVGVKSYSALLAFSQEVVPAVDLILLSVFGNLFATRVLRRMLRDLPAPWKSNFGTSHRWP